MTEAGRTETHSEAGTSFFVYALFSLGKATNITLIYRKA